MNRMVSGAILMLAVCVGTTHAHAGLIKFTIGASGNEQSNKSGVINVSTSQVSDPQICPPIPPPVVEIGANISASIAATAIRDAYDTGACALVDVDVNANEVTVNEAVQGYIQQTAGLYSSVSMEKVAQPGPTVPPGPSDLTIPQPDPGNLALIIQDLQGNNTPVLNPGVLLVSLQLDGGTVQAAIPFGPNQDENTTDQINEALNAAFAGFSTPSGISYLGLVLGYPTFGANFNYDFTALLGVSCLDGDETVICGPDNDPGFTVGAIHTAFVVPEPAGWLVLGLGLFTMWPMLRGGRGVG